MNCAHLFLPWYQLTAPEIAHPGWVRVCSRCHGMEYRRGSDQRPPDDDHRVSGHLITLA